MQDPLDTTQPAHKKQKTSSNFSIGRLQNKAQLTSLVKVKKDKTNGQKAAEKLVVNTNTSSKDTDGSDTKADAGSSGLGSLGMLGDYSSSEDSDQLIP